MSIDSEIVGSYANFGKIPYGQSMVIINKKFYEFRLEESITMLVMLKDVNILLLLMILRMILMLKTILMQLKFLMIFITEII